MSEDGGGKVATVLIHMVNVICFLIFVAIKSIKWHE